jgi:hypothetical protein
MSSVVRELLINGLSSEGKINIQLPQIEYKKYAPSILYGGDSILKKYTHSLLIPRRIYGEWVHGIIYDYMHFHPYAIIGGNGLKPNNPNWVCRKIDEEYLKLQGIEAKAIGAPICYLSKLLVNYERIPNSLLVMPAHSSFYIDAYNKDKSNSILDYVDYIIRIAPKFSHVVVCLHAECIKSNLWVNEFQDKGIEVIQGASSDDSNALERIRALMSQFEFVTSNVLGSHVAYAAFFGAKVSIAGPYHKWHRETFLREPFYAEHEYLLDVLLNEESLVRESLPFLFTEPEHALHLECWGKEMLGEENMLPPDELSKLLRINVFREFLCRFMFVVKKIARPFLNLYRNKLSG